MAAEILTRLKALPPLQQRKAAAILGALVADAAAAPLHWIYDQSKVKSLTQGGENVTFYPTSECPYYKIKTGRLSAYGDQAFATLKSIAEQKSLDIQKLEKQYFEFFGPGTDYDDALQQRAKGKSPVIGPWTNGCVRIFLDKYASGERPFTTPSSNDPDGFVKSIPVIALYAGNTKDMLEAVDKTVQTMQSSPTAVVFALAAARILEYFIIDAKDPVNDACANLKKADRLVAYEEDCHALATIEKTLDIYGQPYVQSCPDKPHEQVVQENGLACSYPASFIGSLHGVLSSSNFESGVKKGILASGDNCSRLALVGACMAAKYGIDSIPVEWIFKMTCAVEALQYIETLVQIQ